MQIRQILWGFIKKARHLSHVRGGHARWSRSRDQGGGSQGGIMELKSTDGGCLLTGGAAVIFIITRIRRRPSHNILGTAPGPARKCEQEMEL